MTGPPGGAKAEILARIGTALGDRPAPVPIPRAYRASGSASAVDLVERFDERVADYQADVRRCVGADLPATLAAAITDRRATRMVVPAGLPPEWLTALERPEAGPAAVDSAAVDSAAVDPADPGAVGGIAATTGAGPAYTLVGDDPPLAVGELDRVDGVLTSCTVAVAETGTIVLDHGPGQGRRALTLVPDYHLVVVLASQIVAGVPDAVAALDPYHPQTWISGPSATSDIELSRVEGVHGPRTLDVVIVTDA